MKHGLKQEIRRGLSILLAASMVAGSALPVMAEEVVEEAVVEVSEEVADEAGDVVVDVAEDEAVVEEVLDGDVVSEEAGYVGEPVESHTHTYDQYDVTWSLTGESKSVAVTRKCSADGEADSKLNNKSVTSFQLMDESKIANASFVDNFVVVYDVNTTGTSCAGKRVTTYSLYERTGAGTAKEPYEYIKRAGTQVEETLGSHNFGSKNDAKKPVVISVDTKATCTTDGTVKIHCYNEDADIILSAKDMAKEPQFANGQELNSYLEAAKATGHTFEIDSTKVTWADDYKSATFSAKCKNCNLTVSDISIPAAKLGYLINTTSGTPEAVSKLDLSKVHNCVGNTELNLYVSAWDKTEVIKAIDKKGDVKYASEINTKLATDLENNVFASTALNTTKKFKMDVAVPTKDTEVSKTAVAFNWPSAGEIYNYVVNGSDVPVTVDVKCDTCKTTTGYPTHRFKSGATNKNKIFPVIGSSEGSAVTTTYDAEVVVEKEELATATCSADGKVVLTAKLVLNGVTYAAEQYVPVQLTGSSPNVVQNGDKIYVTVPKDNVSTTVAKHKFNVAITNENAKSDATGRKPLEESKYAKCDVPSEGYFECTECKEYVKVVIRVPHKLGEKETDKPATCASDKTYKAECTECGKPITTATATAYENAVKSAKTTAEVENLKTLAKNLKAELTEENTHGHKYVLDTTVTPIWTKDSVTIGLKCANDSHNGAECAASEFHVDKTSTKHYDKVTLEVKDITEKVIAPATYKEAGSMVKVATYKFTDCQGKEWTGTVESDPIEIPKKTEKATPVITIAEKTVATYNGNTHAVKATSTGDVAPVVHYYKDAALTKEFSGAPYTAGKYYVQATVAESDEFVAAKSAVVELVIEKANPTVKVTPTTKTVKNTKKNTVRIKVTQNNINSQTGKVTYKAASSKIKVNSNGVVTVKKGTKKGTYKVTVTVKATTNYNKVTKTVKIKVK